MDLKKKEARYQRIYHQLSSLLKEPNGELARMSTVIAVLHNKFDYYFWTGFYFLKNDALVVGPYQGPVACQVLTKNKGVCWASVNKNETLVVEDVEQFPGHIACDSRSKSEIVIPLRDEKGTVIAVLDVDSKDLSSFDEVDARMLKKILSLIYK